MQSHLNDIIEIFEIIDMQHCARSLSIFDDYLILFYLYFRFDLEWLTMMKTSECLQSISFSLGERAMSSSENLIDKEKNEFKLKLKLKLRWNLFTNRKNNCKNTTRFEMMLPVHG